jgi:hypothetical protein
MHRIFRTALAACAAVAALQSGAATPNEQFFPVLVIRTGPCAPNGVPWANGYVDDLNLVSGWVESDASLLRPLLAQAARKYAAEKQVAPRDCGSERRGAAPMDKVSRKHGLQEVAA